MAAWVRALNPSRRIRAIRDVGMLHSVSRPFSCPTRMGTRLLSTVLSEETNAPTQRRDNDDNSKENRSHGQKQVNGVAPPSLPAAAAAPSHHSVVPHAAAPTAAPTAASASLPALRPEPEHEAAPKPPSTLVPPEPLPKRKDAATATLDDEVAPAVTPIRKASMITDDFPITVVDTEEKAREVLRVLESMSVDVPWACDTEVADIDLKEQGPVGNGKVTCVSIYGGPTVDFGTGDGKGSVLWVENIGKADGLLQLFKGWFEDPTRLKVWHNYGFDRHVLNNEGIDVKGFFADTMHLARLHNTSRDKVSGGSVNGTGYSLEALSEDLISIKKISMKELFGQSRLRKDGTDSKIKELPPIRELQENPLFREEWIKYSSRDSLATWQLARHLITELRLRPWMTPQDGGREQVTLPGGVKGNMYHFYDIYFKLFGELLTDMEAVGIKVDQRHLADAEERARKEREDMQKRFIEWAMKRNEDAAHMNTASPAQIGFLLFGEFENGKQRRDVHEKVFKIDKDEAELAAESTAVLLANPYAKHGAAELKALLKERGLKQAGKKTDLIARLLDYDRAQEKAAAAAAAAPVVVETEAETAVPAEAAPPALPAAPAVPTDGSAATGATVDYKSLPLKTLRLYCQTRGIKVDTEGGVDKAKKKDLIQILEAADGEFSFEAAYLGASGPSLPEIAAKHVAAVSTLLNDTSAAAVASPEALQNAQLTPPKKYREIRISTLNYRPTDFTPTGTPQVSAAVLRKMAGKNPLAENEEEAKYGTLFDEMGRSEAGKEACKALGALANVGQIDSTITNFLVPLQTLMDKRQRVHCSLNLNTETGRLSSRRPNLQNQPALEKDQYKIRDAFVAEEGKTLIVADYGQLELRILAHITNCGSMIEAFRSGGCFHSRTAVGMYPHVKAAVDNGDVLLEWDYSKGQPTVPLVKDTFASERRKAKTLNFSIAYGKTVHGLAQDWGISKEEAQETLDAWYRDRPEVKKWQEDTREFAIKHKYVETIMGRRRDLPEASKDRSKASGHALRAAINTPIQGSAADIVMMAMINLWSSTTLQELGWKLLLQIHDEVILEGPIESKDAAMAEVRRCMEDPYDDVLKPLRVHLDVDAKCAPSWYKAK